MTKLEINKKTKTEKGGGFNPEHRFSTDIKINKKYHSFEKPFNSNTGTEIFVTTMGKHYPETEMIGDCYNKAGYIDVLYKYINNILG